ncbi:MULTISPECIES: hypothetical protein [Paenibacillus]|uniref:hypothetical protein n=1 Tax=Paenibacillus TaxID=44249 RepID=UPI002FE24AB4
MEIDIKDWDEKYPEISSALQTLSHRCGGAKEPWLLGGSCGLWLQGVPLDSPPRDIDIYADMTGAEELHGLLAEAALDEPRLDQSGLYLSQLSHYRLNDWTLELVGGFQVRAEGAKYQTEVSEVLAPNAPSVRLGGAELRLMPLSHEFVFNFLRGRPDRYLNIAGVMRREAEHHLPLLYQLLRRNQWSAETVARMAELLNQPLLSGPWGELENARQ